MKKIICTECGEIWDSVDFTSEEVTHVGLQTFTDYELNKCRCGCEITLYSPYGRIPIYCDASNNWNHTLFNIPVPNGEMIYRSCMFSGMSF